MKRGEWNPLTAVASKDQNGMKKAPATSSTHNPRRRLQGSKGMISKNEISDGDANRDEKTSLPQLTTIVRSPIIKLHLTRITSE